MNIMKILPKILIGIVLLILTVTNLAVAYIVFAPDNLPKPFYLLYAVPSQLTPSAPVESPVDTKTTPQIKITNIEPGQGLMVDTGSKIVNLVDPTGRKYLRVGVVIEFAPTDPAYFDLKTAEEKQAYIDNFNKEIEAKMPIINDTLITLFASQSFDNVYTAEGKETLRAQIKENLNKQLPEYQIIAVYFTEFVVQ